MRKFLPTVLMSLGVMVMAGGAFATAASAQTAVGTASATQTAIETSCVYPSSSGLRTNADAVSGASVGDVTASGTCWPTNTIPSAPAPAAAVSAPDGATTPTTVAPTSPGVETASPAPVITTTATSGLAFTGADIWQSVLLGVILIGGGVFFVRLARRRRSSRLS